MRTLLLLLLASLAIGQDSRSESRRARDEAITAKNRDAARRVAQNKFDDEIARLEKPEPMPEVPKLDKLRSPEDLDGAVARYKKDVLARDKREEARIARLYELRAARRDGVTSLGEVDQWRVRAKEETAERELNKPAVGQRRQVKPDRVGVVAWKLASNCTQYGKLLKANDIDGAGTYREKCDAPMLEPGAEFILIEHSILGNWQISVKSGAQAGALLYVSDSSLVGTSVVRDGPK